MKKVFLIAGIVILGLGGLAFFGLNWLRNNPQVAHQLDTAKVASCGDNQEFFTYSPIKLDDFAELDPLGEVSPPAHTFPTDHVYFMLKVEDPTSEDSIKKRVPVYAIGDYVITRISSQERSKNGVPDTTDYSFDFSPCQEVSGYHIHLAELAAKLSQVFEAKSLSCNEYSTGGHDYKNCEANVEIDVSAGEEIGFVGGSVEQGAFDLGLLDYRVEPLEYANPKRWPSEKNLYTVCPLDYFASPVKEELYDKLGRGLGPRDAIKATSCGQINQDIVGTAQGIWFYGDPKNTYPEDPHLALIHDNVETNLGLFSVGNSLEAAGISAGKYYYEPQNTGLVNRDFSGIRPGDTYCFETFDFWQREQSTPFTILLELTNPETLTVDGQLGASCANGPWQLSAQAQTFNR